MAGRWLYHVGDARYQGSIVSSTDDIAVFCTANIWVNRYYLVDAPHLKQRSQRTKDIKDASVDSVA